MLNAPGYRMNRVFIRMVRIGGWFGTTDHD
jgi:hypothetical protein